MNSTLNSARATPRRLCASGRMADTTPDPHQISPITVRDAAAREVVRAHLDPDSIAEQDTNAKLAHFPARVRQKLVPIIELDFELRIRQGVDHRAVHFDRVVLRQRRQCIAWRARVDRLSIATPSGSSSAALRLETVGAIDGFVATGLEGDARFAIATGARSHEHFAPWRSGIAAGGVAGRTGPERIGSLCFALCAAGGATAGWIVEPATRVKLLLAAREDERRIAITARERLVCVLHADSRKKEVVEVSR